MACLAILGLSGLQNLSTIRVGHDMGMESLAPESASSNLLDRTLQFTHGKPKRVPACFIKRARMLLSGSVFPGWTHLENRSFGTIGFHKV